jgi:hypothetical protein
MGPWKTLRAHAAVPKIKLKILRSTKGHKTMTTKTKISKAVSVVEFFPKLTEAKQEKLWLLQSAIDYLIVTTPVDQNPMTNGGDHSWKWGLIKVDGKEFPAPYQKVGYDWANVKIALEPEYSAATNLAIWLETLYDYAKNPELVHPHTRYNCAGAFRWILSLREAEYHSIMMKLTLKCYENDAASRVIN